MKIIFITGSHPRHACIARSLAQTGYLSNVIIEQREEFIQTPPPELDAQEAALFTRHFNERAEAESELFGEAQWPDCNITPIDVSELNSEKVHNIIKSEAPDLVLTYGCHKLSNQTLALIQGEAWNCHGGLSPEYKGAVTHFWPSYMLEPQMTGMTVHELTERLDAGAIVHQCAADLVRGDGIHQLAGRAVLKLATELPALIERLAADAESIEKQPQVRNGKLWLGQDWRPEHLKLVYEFYDNKIVDHYLDGKIQNKPPELFRQF